MSDSSSLDRAGRGEDNAEIMSEATSEELDAPPERVIRRIMAGVFQQQSGPAYHPIFDKMEPAHVGKFLDYSHEEDMEDRSFRRSERWFRLGYVLLAVALGLFLLIFLLDRDRQLLLEIFKLAAAFAAGVGTGYGVKAARGRSKG